MPASGDNEWEMIIAFIYQNTDKYVINVLVELSNCVEYINKMVMSVPF